MGKLLILSLLVLGCSSQVTQASSNRSSDLANSIQQDYQIACIEGFKYWVYRDFYIKIYSIQPVETVDHKLVPCK